MEEQVIVDSTGAEIVPGAIITYPVRRGSSMWMSHAVVKEVGFEERPYTARPYPVLKVVVPSCNWLGEPTGKEMTARVLSPDRCVVLTTRQATGVSCGDHLLEIATEVRHG